MSSTISATSNDKGLCNEIDCQTSKHTFSLQRVVEDIDWVIRWEQLNGCQEAAYEDIPSNHSDCLLIFSSVASGQPERRVQDDLLFQNLITLLGATRQPWPLPPPLYDLSEEDKVWVKNTWAHGLSEVQPTAAIYSPRMAITHGASRVGLIRRDDSKFIAGPILASTVITSSEETFGKEASFYTLRRYNRLATTSVLRTAYSLGIDIPVLGILLCYNRIAIHIDWYQIVYGEFTCNSTFYPSDNEEIRTWDLDRPEDFQQIAQIFMNIRNYTTHHFDDRICEKLQPSRIAQPRTPYSLPESLSSFHLDNDIPSPPSTPNHSIIHP
ncbi:hypothetical protein Clacol_004136 [Clathrus columnatus]|uniref:Uncharacterized protein n=1 Tax=Clathrus columnatus TaxID=1419009 RepID=A0AAV5A8R0_9AGAM|nr:hypothetical protein Clacol_004136 [Clathrus columnatus]